MAILLCVFDKCCCCVNLRLGCFIIGYLNLIVSSITIIFAIFTMVDDAELAVAIINRLNIVVIFALAIVLLVGLHKGEPGCVKAFIIYYYRFLVIPLAQLIWELAVSTHNWGNIGGRAVAILVNTYFVMIINSYYYQMLAMTTGSPYQIDDTAILLSSFLPWERDIPTSGLTLADDGDDDIEFFQDLLSVICLDS